MWDEELNSTIDEVARQMTDPAPGEGAGFRRRVLERIAAGDAPRRNWRAGFVLSPIAVAAAMVIAVMFVRRPAGPVEPMRQTPPLAAVTPRETATPGLSAFARPDAPRASARPAEAPAAGRRFGAGAPAPDGSAPAIAVLSVPPLTVDPIALSPIETDSMPLQTLDAIAPIGVTPLGSPSEGDRP
jgi:hypothetical protein